MYTGKCHGHSGLGLLATMPHQPSRLAGQALQRSGGPSERQQAVQSRWPWRPTVRAVEAVRRDGDQPPLATDPTKGTRNMLNQRTTFAIAAAAIAAKSPISPAGYRFAFDRSDRRHSWCRSLHRRAWSEVGPGWTIATWARSPTRPGVESAPGEPMEDGVRDAVPRRPVGNRYAITTFPAGERPDCWTGRATAATPVRAGISRTQAGALIDLHTGARSTIDVNVSESPARRQGHPGVQGRDTTTGVRRIDLNGNAAGKLGGRRAQPRPRHACGWDSGGKATRRRATNCGGTPGRPRTRGVGTSAAWRHNRPKVRRGGERGVRRARGTASGARGHTTRWLCHARASAGVSGDKLEPYGCGTGLLFTHSPSDRARPPGWARPLPGGIGMKSEREGASRGTIAYRPRRMPRLT